MTDDDPEGHGAPYPDYDTAWRNQKTEAKHAVSNVLSEYPHEIQIAVLSKLTDEYVQRWAEHSYSEQHFEDGDGGE